MLARTLFVLGFLASFAHHALAQQAYDVVVYGGTSGGVTAAVQAARMGKSVLLISERTARSPAAMSFEDASTHKLVPGDVLGVYVEGVIGRAELPAEMTSREAIQGDLDKPAYTHGFPVPVLADGHLSLPMLSQKLRVTGLTVAHAEELIAKQYVDDRILRAGTTVVVVTLETGRHLGGLTSGGLGATDIGNKAAIGGLSRDFYRGIKEYYESKFAWTNQTPEEHADKRKGKVDEDAMWTFEPHVAEGVLRGMLAEAQVPVVFNVRLDRKNGVTKDGTRITSIRMESGETYKAKMFIDATYEGDLMASAGCSYHVGREANSQYGETLNGVQLGSKKHQFLANVDPYVKPGDPASGLLPGVHGGDPGEHGEGDKRVQAYNFRMCLTDDPANMRPFYKPEGYDPLRYELSLRTIAAQGWKGFGSLTPMPNRKTDTNNAGAFSTDNIGMNYDYPEADYATREKIWQEHVTYQLGWMYFLANDERLPEEVRAATRKWGLAKDEFTDTGNWPNQLYVREARRMVSDYVMTEANCRGTRMAPDPVGMAAYGMDSHNTQRWVKDGHCSNEGDVQVHGFSPYGIAYKSIVPKETECANLLVPVCMSATHIAYGSIRMEPVFMVLGQSSATAACHAIDENVPVQQVNTSKLSERLKADNQVLEWTGPKTKPVQAADLPGIVADDNQAKLTGIWDTSSSAHPFVGAQYLHSAYEKDVHDGKSARFEIPVKTAGHYDVRICYAPQNNRATNVPITVESADGSQTVTVNQRTALPIDKMFRSLGTFRFTAEKPAVVVISTDGANGFVIVDAVQLLPVEK